MPHSVAEKLKKKKKNRDTIELKLFEMDLVKQKRKQNTDIACNDNLHAPNHMYENKFRKLNSK